MNNIDFWKQNDERIVSIEGHAHKLEVRTINAIYPYKRTELFVHAVPIYKKSEYYQKVFRKLREDWSVDVLASVDVEMEIINQLSN